MFPRPVEKLRPLVHSSTRKYNSKLRYGRGFTLAELRKAKLSPAFAQTIGISVDHRRHSVSEEALQLNAQRLESYKSKLILFPRRADKPKKGEVNDATADKIASADSAKQNTTKHVFAKPARKLHVASQKITKEQRDVKVFRKLRQLRTNAKYLGKREKKAKEAAEAAAAAKEK